jgi:tetratricopeptide (TPR) repeat protein
VSNLFVIARNSSFAYKGKAVSVKQIAKELGVRYILEGSVQRAGDRVRITAQLIDAITDFHMWSETYDRDLCDIFELQDEITMKLISVMEIKLVYGEQAHLWAGVMTGNIRAYEKCIRAYECYQRFTEHDTFKAIGLAEESIALDEEYPYPYVVLGLSHWSTINANWSKSPFDSFNKAEECAEKAFALTEAFDLTYILKGFIELAKRNHDKAIEYQRTALKLNPNGAYALASLSYVLSWAGRLNEAIPLVKRAFRLNPIPPTSYYITLAMALRFNGQYEEALEVSKKLIAISPDSITGHVIMTVAYFLLKDYDNARRSAEEILRVYPSYSIDTVRLIAPFKHESSLNEVIDAFRKVGIPEHSPE